MLRVIYNKVEHKDKKITYIHIMLYNKRYKDGGIKNNIMKLPLPIIFALCAVMTSVCFSEINTKHKKWKLHTELSFVKTTGNTDTDTISIKFDTSREDYKNKLFVKGSGLYAKTDQEETAARFDIKGRWERMFTTRFFSFLTTGFLTDKFSGYEYRINGGPGIGYYLLYTGREELKILSSVLFYKDREYLSPFKEDSYTSAELEIFYKIYIRENLSFKSYLNYSISLNDKEKYFLTGDFSIEVSINSNISMGVGYQIYYQNKLPDPAVKRLDTTFLTSLIINI